MGRGVFLIAAVVAVVALAGCVSVSKTVLDHSRSSNPVPLEEVFVYLASAGDEVSTECQRVAVVHASGSEGLFTDQGDILNKIREEVGKLGANAIYVQSIEEPRTGERIVQGLLGVPADTDVDALALWCPQELIDKIRRGE